MRHPLQSSKAVFFFATLAAIAIALTNNGFGQSSAPKNEKELIAILRGASLECPMCGEFILHRSDGIGCPQCGLEIEAKVLSQAVQLFLNDQLVVKDRKVIFRPGRFPGAPAGGVAS